MIYIMAVSEFFKTERVNFVYIDLKNRDEVKINYTPELGEDYRERLLSITDKISHSELPDKKSECSCEYSPVCF